MRNMEPPEKYKMAVKVPQNGRWAEVYIPQMVQVLFPNTIPGVPVFFPEFFSGLTFKIIISSPDPPNNYFLLYFWAIISQKI